MSLQLNSTMQAMRVDIVNRYAPGDQLPNELQLAAQYGVSRATIRDAVSRLAVEGVLDKRWGVGTFVQERQPDSFGMLSYRPGLVPSLRSLGGEVTLLHFSRTQAEPDPELFTDFPYSPLVRLERTYAIDGRPAVWLSDLMVAEHQGQRIDFGDDNWMELKIPELMGAIGLEFDELSFRLHARLATESEQQMLALDGPEPVLANQGEARDERGRVLIVIQSTVNTAVARPKVSAHL